jgi:hypothetical protein
VLTVQWSRPFLTRRIQDGHRDRREGSQRRRGGLSAAPRRARQRDRDSIKRSLHDQPSGLLRNQPRTERAASGRIPLEYDLAYDYRPRRSNSLFIKEINFDLVSEPPCSLCVNNRVAAFLPHPLYRRRRSESGASLTRHSGSGVVVMYTAASPRKLSERKPRPCFGSPCTGAVALDHDGEPRGVRWPIAGRRTVARQQDRIEASRLCASEQDSAACVQRTGHAATRSSGNRSLPYSAPYPPREWLERSRPPARGSGM